MARSRTRVRPIRSSFNVGGLAAESDHLLTSAFYDNGDYEIISSRGDRRCFIVGRTGSGKSAALTQLEYQYPDRVIRVSPENLSLPYLADLGIIRRLLELDVHLEGFFTALWKHVILVEVIKHRYKVNSPEAKQNFLSYLLDRLSRDPAKARALNYLEEFGDRFWCDTDERVRQITETFVTKVTNAGDLKLGIPRLGGGLTGSKERTHTVEERTELASIYQQVVNETQIPRLNEMIAVLDDEILDSDQHFTYLIIDDLDKQWVDDRLVNILVRCLFQAVSDMVRVKNLKILVAIRTNLLTQLDFGSRTKSGQEEKYRGLTLELRWTENDLKGLLEQRLEAASDYFNVGQPVTLDQMLPNTGKSRGNPIDYILERTLMRPRDAILFINSCLRQAAGKRAVSWKDISHAEREYSRERLYALRDEWKNPYTDIDHLLIRFAGRQVRFDRSVLLSVLDDAIVDLHNDRMFRGLDWLSSITAPVFGSGSEADSTAWDSMYDRFILLLLEIGFLGVCDLANRRPVYSHDEAGDFLDEEAARGEVFEVHPAFRRGLEFGGTYRALGAGRWSPNEATFSSRTVPAIGSVTG